MPVIRDNRHSGRHGLAPVGGEGSHCPCCRQQVTGPSLSVVIELIGPLTMEARVLAALWAGRGFPVSSEELFDAMYADDPNGGLSTTQMYCQLRLAVCNLKIALPRSGMTVAKVKSRPGGYKLRIGQTVQQTVPSLFTV